MDGPPSPQSQPDLVATLTQPSAGSGLVLNQSLDHTGLSIKQQGKQDQGSWARPYRWAILSSFFGTRRLPICGQTLWQLLVSVPHSFTGNIYRVAPYGCYREVQSPDLDPQGPLWFASCQPCRSHPDGVPRTLASLILHQTPACFRACCLYLPGLLPVTAQVTSPLLFALKEMT